MQIDSHPGGYSLQSILEVSNAGIKVRRVEKKLASLIIFFFQSEVLRVAGLSAVTRGSHSADILSDNLITTTSHV